MAVRPGDPADDTGVEVQRLRRLFRLFAATQCRGRSRVYEALSEGVAGEDELLDLLMSAPGEQRRPSLLFAAVNLLSASDPGSAPAGYYPVHGGRRPVDGRLALVEAGASAGLNLLVDRYRYRVGGQESSAVGASPVTVSCEVRGGAPAGQILGPVPEITCRWGMDQRPVDLADPYLRWLALARDKTDDFQWLPPIER